MSGVLGIKRFGFQPTVARKHNDQHLHSTLCDKILYSLAVIVLASILLLWANVIHNVYKTTYSSLFLKGLVMLGVTVFAFLAFVAVTVISLGCRKRRHPSPSAMSPEDGHQQHHIQQQHAEGVLHHELKSDVTGI